MALASGHNSLLSCNGSAALSSEREHFDLPWGVGGGEGSSHFHSKVYFDMLCYTFLTLSIWVNNWTSHQWNDCSDHDPDHHSPYVEESTCMLRRVGGVWKDGWLGRASNPGQRTITLVGCRKRQPPCYKPSNTNKHLAPPCFIARIFAVLIKFNISSESLKCSQCMRGQIAGDFCLFLILTFINLRTNHRFSMSSA